MRINLHIFSCEQQKCDNDGGLWQVNKEKKIATPNVFMYSKDYGNFHIAHGAMTILLPHTDGWWWWWSAEIEMSIKIHSENRKKVTTCTIIWMCSVECLLISYVNWFCGGSRSRLCWFWCSRSNKLLIYLCTRTYGQDAGRSQHFKCMECDECSRINKRSSNFSVGTMCACRVTSHSFAAFTGSHSSSYRMKANQTNHQFG